MDIIIKIHQRKLVSMCLWNFRLQSHENIEILFLFLFWGNSGRVRKSDLWVKSILNLLQSDAELLDYTGLDWAFSSLLKSDEFLSMLIQGAAVYTRNMIMT